jgi:hypothetical protein
VRHDYCDLTVPARVEVILFLPRVVAYQIWAEYGMP